jgi:hypothetical protein
MAPAGSVTVPVMDPRSLWASIKAGTSKDNNSKHNIVLTCSEPWKGMLAFLFQN